MAKPRNNSPKPSVEELLEAIAAVDSDGALVARDILDQLQAAGRTVTADDLAQLVGVEDPMLGRLFEATLHSLDQNT